jgi:hypothetical protein
MNQADKKSEHLSNKEGIISKNDAKSVKSHKFS